MTVKLRRSPSQYRGGTPEGVAGGSKAQMMYYVEDSKADIATLLFIVESLQDTLITALPYVQSAEFDELYKPGVVRKVIDKMSAAIALAEGSDR